MLPAAAFAQIHHQPTGTLAPILVDALGVPVLAIWISPTPTSASTSDPTVDGNAVLDWLVTQALPEYVPAAMRRARSARYFVDPARQSPRRDSRPPGAR